MKPDASPPSSDEAWIESVLHDQPSAYIDDAGFSARVVTALPRRSRNRRRTWLLAGATIIGCAIAGPVAGPALFDVVARLPDQLAAGLDAVGPLTMAGVFVGVGLIFAARPSWHALRRHR